MLADLHQPIAQLKLLLLWVQLAENSVIGLCLSGFPAHYVSMINDSTQI